MGKIREALEGGFFDEAGRGLDLRAWWNLNPHRGGKTHPGANRRNNGPKEGRAGIGILDVVVGLTKGLLTRFVRMSSWNEGMEREGIEKNGLQERWELKVSNIWVSPEFRVLMSFLSFGP